MRAHVGGGGQEPGPGREAPAGKGIEDPHLDVRVLAQVQEAAVFAGGVEVIDQQAHPHAAIRRQAHMMQQQPRRIVLVDDVVLDVEGALGMVGKRDQARRAPPPRRPAGGCRTDCLLACSARARCARARWSRACAAPRCVILCTCCGRPRSRPSRGKPAAESAAHAPGPEAGFAHREHHIRHTLRPCRHHVAFAASFCAPAAPRAPRSARLRALARLRHRAAGRPARPRRRLRPRARRAAWRSASARRGDRQPGGGQSGQRLPRHRGAPAGRRPAAAARRAGELHESARHLSRCRGGA